MKIKDFEKKYSVNFNGCFVYDGVLRLKEVFNNLPTHIDSEDGQLSRTDFIDDFMELEV